MRIVEVINTLKNRGGAQVFFYNLCKEIMFKKEHELFVVVLYDEIHESFCDLINSNDCCFYTCKKKRNFDFRASFVLKKIIKDIKPDVINFHLSFLPTYFMAFGTKKRSWKLVKTYHSIPGNDLSKINYFFEKRYVKNDNLFFIGISDGIVKASNELYKGTQCCLAYNGIPNLSNGTGYVSNKKDFDFICVASFENVKNHKLLFDSFCECLNQFPHLKLLCVGGGSLLDYYKDYVKNKKMLNNVFFSGSVDNVSNFYQNSKCFVLSSLREGNPISILEAMSFGLPIIAPNVGGIPDIVKDKDNGFLYERNNKKELTQIMKEFCLNYSTFKKMGENNINYSSRFSIENTYNQYIDFFNNIK